MSSLSTHVLDTTHGCPAAGVSVRLTSGGLLLFEGATDADGRCRDLPPLLPGRLEIAFADADYFRAKRTALPDPPFLDVVTVAFGVSEADGHYHVPLLVSPFGYSTYRGS